MEAIVVSENFKIEPGFAYIIIGGVIIMIVPITAGSNLFALLI